MGFRDIDYSIRVNGDLSVPSHSIKVGANIQLNSADGTISATKLSGDGSLLTSVNATLIDGLDSSQFMRSDTNTSTSGTITVNGNSVIFPPTHSKFKISLYDDPNDAHTIGTEAYHTTINASNMASSTASVGTKFYLNSTEVAAQIGFGGSGAPSNRFNSQFNGNVGINVAASDVALTITPTTGNWSEGIAINPSTSSGYSAVLFRTTANSATGTWFVGKHGSTNDFNILRNGLSGMVGTGRADSPFDVLHSNGNARFGAKVGIGVSSPSEKLDVSGIIKTSDAVITGNLIERFITLPGFPNSVAHQKIDLLFDQFWGTIEISLTSSYAHQNASGVITKVFGLGLNPNGSIYTNTGRYTEVEGPTADNFAISNVVWDSALSKYKITVVHRTSTSNTAHLRIRGFATSDVNREQVKNMAVGSIYTTDTTVYDKPIVEMPRINKLDQLGGGHRLMALTNPGTPTITAIGAKGTPAAAEVASLKVTAAATADGSVTVTLDGVATNVAVLLNDTAIAVADKIRATAFTGWTTGGTAGTDTVTFTANATGPKTDATYSAGTTGATGTMTTTTQGKNDTRTRYEYSIIAEDLNGGKTLASQEGVITDGNPTLDATNYNAISWSSIHGAVKYYVLKTDTATLLGTTNTTTFDDKGQVTSAFSYSPRNSTANMNVDGSGTFGLAHIGESSIYSGWAVFSNKNKNTNNGYALLQDNGGTTILNSEADKNLHFRIGNSDRMIMHASGAKLELRGTMTIYDGANNGLRIGSSQLTDFDLGYGFWITPRGSFSVGTSYDWDKLASFEFNPATEGNNDQKLKIGQFKKNLTTWTQGFLGLYASGVERLTIDNNGRVGIGTTTPQYQLDVAGEIKSLTQITIEGGSPQLRFIDTDNTGAGKNYWIHNNSGRLYFLQDSDGNGTWDSPYPMIINANRTVEFAYQVQALGGVYSGGNVELGAEGIATSTSNYWSRVVRLRSSKWNGTAAETKHGYMQLDDNGGFYFASDGSGAATTILRIDNAGNLSLPGTVDGVDVSAFKSSYDSHTHDERYYTETEVNNLLAGKSDTSHNHDSTYLKLTGGTLTGSTVISNGASMGLQLKGADGATANRLQLLQEFWIGQGTAAERLALRFHQSGRWWHRLEASSNGFHTKTGSETSETYVSLFTGNLDATGNITLTGTVDGVDVSGFKSAYDTHVTETGVGKHVPSGGTTSTFLRGDGTWVTPTDTDTNNYLTGVTGSGNGTVTFTRQGLLDLTWNAAHTHDDRYYTEVESDGRFLGISAKAADSELLDGLNSTAFSRSSSAPNSVVSYDNRTVNDTPSSRDRGLYIDFKENVTNGLHDGGSYNGVLTFRVYGGGTDLSGGPTHQLGFSSTGGVWHRVGVDATTWGTWQEFWTSGNLNPVVVDGANQTVGNSFTVKGLMAIANNGSTIGGELYILNKGGTRTLELDSELSSAHNNITSGLNILMGGVDGSAKFAGTVKVNSLVVGTTSGAPLTVASTSLVANLNSEFLGGLKWDMYDTKVSNYDIGGDGVYTGVNVKEISPSPTDAVTVDAGVVYLQDGTRATFAGTESITIPKGDASYDRIDVVYVAGSGSHKGNLQVAVGTPAASPTVPAIPSDAVKLAELRVHKGATTITDGSSSSVDMVDDKRRWKNVRYYMSDTSLNVEGMLKVGTQIQEGGIALADKYAELATANTFNSNQTINGTVNIVGPTGTLGGDANSANFKLKVSSDGQHIAIDSNEILATADLNIGSGAITTLNATRLYVNAKVRAPQNANTVTIPAGQTEVTWTHNYGGITYAVNLTSNSFERHVRWKPGTKLDNSIVIEIDDPSTQEILVDCILIGY